MLYQLISKTSPPSMKKMTFIATGMHLPLAPTNLLILFIEDLLQHMERLRKDMIVECDLQAFDLKFDTIICHFEPFRQGHAPFQLSDSNRPIAIRKEANEAGHLSRNIAYSLDKPSMHIFMRRFAMGSLPPSLRGINVRSTK